MENKTEDLVETPSTSLPDYFSDENEIVTCTDMIALQKILPEEVRKIYFKMFSMYHIKSYQILICIYSRSRRFGL